MSVGEIKVVFIYSEGCQYYTVVVLEESLQCTTYYLPFRNIENHAQKRNGNTADYEVVYWFETELTDTGSPKNNYNQVGVRSHE